MRPTWPRPLRSSFRTRTRATLFLVVAVVISSSLALIATTQRVRAATLGGLLRIGKLNLQITTFNPMVATLSDEFVVTYNTYSTLLTRDKDDRVEGDLASSWSLAPDNVTWTFHLVHDAYFADPANPTSRSHPVTASDVVFTYQLQMAQTGSHFNRYVTPVLAVSAVDSYTVQVVTRQPYAAMNATLTTIPILPAYVWSGVTYPVMYSPAYPIGSGAMYYDTANSSSSQLILRRSPLYYGPADYGRQVQPDDVQFIGYADAATMVNGFLTGGSSLDAVEGVDPASYVGSLARWSPKWGVDEGFVGEISNNVLTNAERSELVAAGLTQFRTGSNNQTLANNATVRRAIAMSVNRTALVRDALLGQGRAADTLVPESNPWHYAIPSNDQIPFNPLAARALLNGAGWAWDASGSPANSTTVPLYRKGAVNNTVYWPLTFRFYTLNTAPEWQIAAQDIVAWLAQAGIRTVDRTGGTTPGYGLYALNQMSGYWLSGDYDMWLWDWPFSPASDPSVDILNVETTMAIDAIGSPNSAWSDNFYSNSTYDSLYNQSLVAMSLTARRSLTDTMQSMIYRYASYILPYYRFDLFAALDQSSPSLGAAARWTNWGNWSLSPGLAPETGLPNLWFQVRIPPPDTTPPVTTLTLSGTVGHLGWFISNVSVSLAATDDLTGIASTTYSLDNGAWQPYLGPFVLSSDGNHSVQYQSVDGAGNIEAIHQAYVPIDRTPPTVQERTTGTVGNGNWYVTRATVTLNATDAESGVASIVYRVDSGNWTTYAGPFTVGDGSHAVAYGATDVAGNNASFQTTTVRVDTAPPVLTHLEPSGHLTTSQVVVTWSASDAGSGIADYALSVDGGAFRDLGTDNSTTLTLSDGAHTITLRATDRAGNNVTQTSQVTIDTNPFSFRGPYGGLPTILLAVAIPAVLTALIWLLRRRRHAPPAVPPPPPAV